MKRKRGNKKGKAKAKAASSVKETSAAEVSPDNNQEENSGGDESGQHETGMEVDNNTSSGADQPHTVASINPDDSVDKLARKSVGLVKVKLKTSKKLESQPASSDAPSHSDNTDRSSQQQQRFQKRGLGVVTEKIEDSANSLPDSKVNLTPKKTGTGGIKIKSSNGLGSSTSQTGSSGLVYAPITYQKQSKATKQDTRYNKQELDAALTIIKKVMKMDAAEPFNVPVNPEALGIPDYFDIIDTPMDFGTICNNLERLNKYKNSEDVFKDVQYIWENCYKYNNKGDYVLDLMRRVKKNFMKYWTGAGLYTENSRGDKGTEATLSEELGLQNQGKGCKGKQKQGKRHGRHKPDCLCAICVLKRRRKERERQARMARGVDKASTEFKLEDTFLVESPGGEDSLSIMEYSAGPDADAEGEEKGEDVEQEASEKRLGSERHEQDGGGDDNDDQEEEEAEEENEASIQKAEIEMMDQAKLSQGLEAKEKHCQPKTKEISSIGEEAAVSQHEAAAVQDEKQTAVLQQQKRKEKERRAKILESLVPENPVVLELCGYLFPQDMNSVWNGPHSLNRNQKRASTTILSAAMETFMGS